MGGGGEPTTIAEYNKQFYPKISRAYCFINNLEHAAQKTGDYKETMMQLSCIGWNDECRETIIKALESYEEATKDKVLKQN